MSQNLTRAMVVVVVALATLCDAVAPGVAALADADATADADVAGAVGGADADATIAVGNASAPPGETVTVPVVVEGESIAGYQANLTWDASVLRFESVSGVDFADPVQNGGEGWLFVTQSQTDGVQSPTVVAVTFTVVGSAGDESEVGLLERDSSANNESSQLPTAVAAGSVTVTADSDSETVGTASAETTTAVRSTTATGRPGSGADAATAATTTAVTETPGDDGDDGGTSPVLIFGGLASAGVVLGAGYLLGQRSGGGAVDADGSE